MAMLRFTRNIYASEVIGNRCRGRKKKRQVFHGTHVSPAATSIGNGVSQMALKPRLGEVGHLMLADVNEIL